MGKYSIGDRPYQSDQGREWNNSLYCSTVGITIIDLLYKFCIAKGTGNNIETLQARSITLRHSINLRYDIAVI